MRVFAPLLLLACSAHSLAQEQKPEPKPPPSFAELQVEWRSLADSGYVRQLPLLRRFAQVKTEECVLFLDGVRRASQEPILRLEALRVMGQVGVAPAPRLLGEVLETGPEAERPTALQGLASVRPPVPPAPFLAALAPGRSPGLRQQAATALRSYPHPEVASRLTGLLAEEPINQSLRRSARASLKQLLADEEVRGWLTQVGLARESSHRAALPALLGLAAGCPDSGPLREAIYGQLRAPEPDVRAAAADALGVLLAGKGALAAHSQSKLLRLLEDGEGSVVISAAVALGAIGPVGDSLESLLGLAKSRDPSLRTLGLSALGLSRDPRAQALARKGLGDKSPGVRAAAVAYLRGQGTREAVDALVDGLKKNKSGRVHAELLRALRALTAANPGDDHRAWRRWWDMARADHPLRPPGSLAAAGIREEGATATRGVPTYYGSEVVSRRLSFIVDISGSMTAPAGTEGQSRIAACKEQLRGVIGALSKKARFNVIWFHHAFTPWAERLAPAGPKQKAAALAAVANLKAGGGTNIFDPLEAALRDPEVDTIYLLSDGGPSAGRIVDPGEILREVRKLNATRRVAIHTISVGSKSAFMQSLAEENGGRALVR